MDQGIASAESRNRLTVSIGWMLLLVLAVTLIPWLGDTLFNTKGEPREAIVALGMLKSGNFILPETYGADIPYKPPFLAWLIAACSFLTGGHVTEFSSRLPSAIATIAMIMAGYRFFARRRGPWIALAVSLVTITSVEVFRAASACRVDMVLTACMVTAIYVMASARERHGSLPLSLPAILLMTLAVLTKGPVGALLPCLVVWVWALLMGDRPVRATINMAVMALASLIVPALWYWAAWQQGGERFLNLVIEENFGRMTGSMSYGSHENPWWYNFVTVFAGMAPYTLLALMALTVARWRRLDALKQWRAMRPDTLLAAVTVAVIFIFYCIPKSKRSVYLLPIYPFLAYFVTLLAIWLVSNGKRRVAGAFAWVMGGVALLAAWAVWGCHMVDIPDNIPSVSGSAADMLGALYDAHFTVVDWSMIVLCILVAGATLCIANRRGYLPLWGAAASALAVYWVAGATVLPAVLNIKSDKVLARQIEEIGGQERVYSFNSAKMLRYYTAAFYLDDTVRLFAPESGSSQSVDSATVTLPDSGLLIVSERDMPVWQELYGKGYAVDTLYTGSRKSCDARAIPLIVRFTSARDQGL